jgi:SAM-dependent methyltransferase
MKKKQNRLETKEKVSKTLLKLDLGCGQNKKEGFKGVDIWDGPGVDYVADLFKFPLPFGDESVEEIFGSHFFEHVPQEKRFGFMDELYRILIPGGKINFITPYWASPRAVQDPTHMWPPIVENSYLYFNKQWREINKLTHYNVKCDFDFCYGYLLDPETNTKNAEAQQFWVRHYINAVSDLSVTLTKRPPTQI